jgi:Ca2+-binding RTX toxin-like protein
MMPNFIYGTQRRDIIDGTALDDVIFGYDGDDVIYGNGGNDVLIGGEGADSLYGGTGRDVLIGGDGDDGLSDCYQFGWSAADELYGGAGNDFYRISNVGTTVIEYAGSGVDTIQTVVAGTYVIPANVERFEHLANGFAVIYGNELDNWIFAETGGAILSGGGGDDILRAGFGSVTLLGGTGNDSYTVLQATTTVYELAGEGIDTVTAREGFSSTPFTAYTLPANVENLIVYVTAGIGNALNNVITGNAGQYNELYGLDGDDTLQSGGTERIVREPGFEADFMAGGRGNDLYFVATAGDSTFELPGEGVDEVRTFAPIYSLQPNIENLTFLEPTDGSAPIGHIGAGNALANIMRGSLGIDELYGREGDDIIYGGTGAANSLYGQEGNDTYYADAVGDAVIEFANQGNDTVYASVSAFTLRDNVENLIYTGTGSFIGVGGDATDNMIRGGSGDDQISGRGGNDVIIGGSGADLLLGGTGADVFRYIGGETGFDRIIDFVSGVDRIALANAGFTHTATVDFILGTAATGARSAFLYNASDGMLRFDPDGTGADAPIAIAQFNPGQILAAGDLVFF